MRWSIDTIVRAIELVGPATQAAEAIYEGFVALTDGTDQEELQKRYAAARQASDAAHDAVQRTR